MARGRVTERFGEVNGFSKGLLAVGKPINEVGEVVAWLPKLRCAYQASVCLPSGGVTRLEAVLEDDARTDPATVWNSVAILI